MVQTDFFIGNGDWLVMAFLDISGVRDLNEVYGLLLSAGLPDYKAQEACMVLSRKNKGYTYTDFKSRFTLTFASRGTSYDELYDSIQHELKHIVEHISDYYGVDPKSEESAYLQGEIAKKMFPAVAMVVCPVCGRIHI